MQTQHSTQHSAPSRSDELQRGLLPPPVRALIGAIAIACLVPYTAMKALWLSGSRIGMIPGSGDGHMHDTRFEIGNVITVGLMVVAAAVVVVLTSRWGKRVPWWAIIVPAAGATGALAPIALGLPVGVVIQAAVLGNVRSGGEGNLSGSVFAVVYGGFGMFGVALAVLLIDYVLRRWGTVIARGPIPPRHLWVRLLCAAGTMPLAVATVVWACARGPFALPGWESLAQRVVLVAIALLALGGSLAMLGPAGGRAPRLRWFAGWVGCCAAAVQGPMLLLLAADAGINPVLLGAAAVATPAAVAVVLSAMRRSPKASVRTQKASVGPLPAA